jgi:hypothetical protein
MVLNKEQRKKMVLELYYERGYTYRQLTRELKMSPNQIHDMIRGNDERENAKANRKKELSLSSKAFRLFSRGVGNVQVVINLDIPPVQVTQLRIEYWRLQDQDSLERLYLAAKGNAGGLWKLYRELAVVKGMSPKEIANITDTTLKKLQQVEGRLEEANEELAMKLARVDLIEGKINALEEEEEKRRMRMVTLPPSSYYYAPENYYAQKANPNCSSLPYLESEYPRQTNRYRNATENPEERDKISEAYRNGDIVE